MTRRDADVTDDRAIRQLVVKVAPAVIINCTGFNDVDGAEDAPSAALAVNAFAVRTLARAAEDCGATLVHYSTDFVFDGNGGSAYDESVRPCPRSTYAMTKLLGEWFALDAPGAFVLRVESLFGSPEGWTGRRGTLDGIVASLRTGREQPVFTDRVVSPSYSLDVAAATRHLLDTAAAPGLYHCVNSGQATWHAIAEEAARLLDVQPRLRLMTMDQVKTRAARPRFCALSNARLAAAGHVMPSWQDALARWLGTAPRTAQ